jgi:hypothetical protein
MKRLLFAAAWTAAAFSAPASAQIGVTVNVGEPGFFGRIEIGGAPPPQLVYSRPVVIEGGPAGVGRDPIYLHVRPGYERNWRRHCGEYNACGQPVFFVKDDWYRNRYVPHYRAHRADYGDHGDHGDRGDRGDHGDHGDRGDRGNHGDRGDHHDHENGDHHDRDDHHGA